MAHKFSIPFDSDPEAIIGKAKSMLESNGGTFSGDSNSGKYSVKLPVGKVEGEYTISNGNINFNITKKPMLVPGSAIESFLKEKLAK